MSKIISIGTAVPQYKHNQQKIFDFMSGVYALSETENRKLRFVYRQSGIDSRYSILPDFSFPPAQSEFFQSESKELPYTTMEKRMQSFRTHAAPLALQAIDECLKDHEYRKVTHLITVSCTGMSAPGLDLELVELLNLPLNTWRTSVNFMGCYAAIHALKIADAICKADTNANVLMVCVEFCTLHLQTDYTPDNVSSGILFSDGAAAVLVTGDADATGLNVTHFYSSIALKGKQEMVWELSSKGFLLNLSSYIPDLLREDFGTLVEDALNGTGLTKEDITHWCIHPGGKRILEAVHSSMNFNNGQLRHSYDVLNHYGNMSSPTVLFVLKSIKNSLASGEQGNIFGAAFGPGLTLETFMLSA